MKASKLGWLGLAVALATAVPVWAAGKSAAISGYIRSSSGVGQMGAAVEIIGSASVSQRVFTDDKGFYSVKGVVPGIYVLRVTAPSFLPSLLENLNLHAGAERVVNVTLNTLFEAVQTMPRRTGQGDDDDWNWTLRSSSNRPILRVLEQEPTVASEVESNYEDHALKGSVAFVAGSSGENFGAPNDMSTAFSVERSVFTSDVFSLNGHVGYGNGSPATVRSCAPLR